jgi:hypothetical protein
MPTYPPVCKGNMKRLHFDMVRAITHTEDATLLAPERYRKYI